MSVNKTVIDAALVLEFLYEDDFKAKSVSTISTELDIPDATVYRILKSWKQAGWVIETPAPTGKGVLWKISNKLVSIAFAYKRFAIDKVQSAENEYRSISGQELKL